MDNENERSNLFDIDENAFQNLRMTAEEKQIIWDELEKESSYHFIVLSLGFVL